MIRQSRGERSDKTATELIGESMIQCPDCGRAYLTDRQLKVHRGNEYTDCTPAETIY